MVSFDSSKDLTYHETTYRSYITRPNAQHFYFTLRRILSMSRRQNELYTPP